MIKQPKTSKSKMITTIRFRVERFVICGFLRRHRYYTIKAYSHTTRKVGCRLCLKVWGMNDRVRSFIPWDGELQELHEDRKIVSTCCEKEVKPTPCQGKDEMTHWDVICPHCEELCEYKRKR